MGLSRPPVNSRLILDYPDIQIIRIRIILDYPGLSGYYTFTLLTPSLPPSPAHPDAHISYLAQSREFME